LATDKFNLSTAELTTFPENVRAKGNDRQLFRAIAARFLKLYY
jgi:hypothetical protein